MCATNSYMRVIRFFSVHLFFVLALIPFPSGGGGGKALECPLECPLFVCCSVLQCVAVCCSVLQCVAVRCSVMLCVAVCCSVL